VPTETPVTPTRVPATPTAVPTETPVTPTRVPATPTALPTETPVTPTRVPATPTALPTETPVTPTRVPATPTSRPQETEAAPQIAPVSVYSERIRNGSFESGFDDQGVGVGWSRFTSGAATYEFTDESLPLAHYDGQHAQRIRVEGAIEPLCYAGIFQTASVVPGVTYQLSLHGQIRTEQEDVKVGPCDCRVQVGFDYNGGQDWRRVRAWIDLPWDQQWPGSAELVLNGYQMLMVPPHSQLTIFIRTWNEWVGAGRVEYTLDHISLVGLTPPEEVVAAPTPPSPTKTTMPPTATPQQTLVAPTRVPPTKTAMPVTATPQQTLAAPTRMPATPTSRPQETEVAPQITPASVFSERIRNGSFEDGFDDQGVGVGWNHFTTGAAAYQFADESWPPARYDGEHAQRIQVEGATEPDRYAGIFQTVTVVPGATYQLSLHGLIRTGQGDVKVSRCGDRVQVGFDYNGGQDWGRVQAWIELPWDEQRLDMQRPVFDDYQMPVVPAGPRMTIFIRTWNKWPEAGRVEYTLDRISLVGLAPVQDTSATARLPVAGGVLDTTSPAGWASCMTVLLLAAGASWQVCQGVGSSEWE
jgi:hypothetical protein